MKKYLMLLIFALGSVSLIGCSSNANTLNANERTQMRTKTFDADYDITFRALMAVFENQGYTIDNTDMNSGLIKATATRNIGDSTLSAFSKFFLGFGTTTGIATFDVSTTISKISQNATKVRINIRQRDATNYSISTNDIDDPEIYQTLFNDLRIEIQRMQAMK